MLIHASVEDYAILLKDKRTRCSSHTSYTVFDDVQQSQYAWHKEPMKMKSEKLLSKVVARVTWNWTLQKRLFTVNKLMSVNLVKKSKKLIIC